MDSVATESLQALDQTFAGTVEVFIHIFQPLRRHGFHSDQGSKYMCRFHGLKEFWIFGGLHGDLGKEDGVRGKLGETKHQFKALSPDRFQLGNAGRIVLARGEFQIGQGDGIEIVVRKSDETEAETAQLDDFFRHRVGRTLARPLPVSTPYGAKRAVFGAAAHGLY